MKVTKAKGLNTIWAARYGYAHPAGRLDRLRLQHPAAEAELLKCVFRPFALVTFIWASK
jgi:hypothetical protein